MHQPKQAGFFISRRLQKTEEKIGDPHPVDDLIIYRKFIFHEKSTGKSTFNVIFS